MVVEESAPVFMVETKCDTGLSSLTASNGLTRKPGYGFTLWPFTTITVDHLVDRGRPFYIRHTPFPTFWFLTSMSLLFVSRTCI